MPRTPAQRAWHERNRELVREQHRNYQRKLRAASALSPEQRRAKQIERNLDRLVVATGWARDECWGIVASCLPHLHPMLQRLAVDLWRTGLKQTEIARSVGQTQVNICIRESKLVRALQLLRSLPLSIDQTIEAVESSSLSDRYKALLTTYLKTNSQTQTAQTIGMATSTVSQLGPRSIEALRALHPVAAETCSRLWERPCALIYVDIWRRLRQ